MCERSRRCDVVFTNHALGASYESRILCRKFYWIENLNKMTNKHAISDVSSKTFRVV